MINQVILLGRLVKAPELRQTQTGTEVCTFTLAVNRKFKNQEGQSEADYINCVAFKNTATLISKYVGKGEKLAITGKITSRSYESANGDKKYVTEVIVEGMTFLEPKKDISEKSNSEIVRDVMQNDSWKDISDDDLPF